MNWVEYPNASKFVPVNVSEYFVRYENWIVMPATRGEEDRRYGSYVSLLTERYEDWVASARDFRELVRRTARKEQALVPCAPCGHIEADHGARKMGSLVNMTFPNCYGSCDCKNFHE